MQTPMPSAHESLRQRSTPPAATDSARTIVLKLNAWAAACPRYRPALDDCAEEIAWAARIPPRAATTPAPGQNHGARQIVTTLRLWAELDPQYARSLRACAEEIQQLAGAVAPADAKLCARDAVLQALADGYQTCPEIARFKGLSLRRVQRAMVRLVQLKLAKDVGCAARTHEDGFRTRLYDLTHVLPRKISAH